MAINVGTLALDGVATPFEIALILPITGATDSDAVATCRYRRANIASPSSLGQVGDWVTGHPLYRIRNDLQSSPAQGTIENAFAWTIIDLESNAPYDVEVTVSSAGDSDVVKGPTTFTTRKLPASAPFPTATIATGTSTSAIKSAIEALTVGQCIQFDDGTHTLAGLQLSLSAGNPAAPIYIRGTSRGGTILIDTTGAVIDLLTCDNVVIENLWIKGSGVDSGTAASSVGINSNAANTSNITVRQVTMSGVDKAWVTGHNEVTGCLCYDFIFVGNNLWTTAFVDTNITWNDDGIQLVGNGNCVFQGTMKGFGDSLAISATNDVFTYNCHYHHLDIRNSCDDLIEADDAFRNITLRDIKSTNSMTLLSVDAVWGGPIIVVRPYVVNVGRQVFKWNGGDDLLAIGVFVYNPTIVLTNLGGNNHGIYFGGPSKTALSYGLRNANVIYRGSGKIIYIDAVGHDPVDWTNNAWYAADMSIIYDNISYSSLANAQANVPTSESVRGFGSVLGAPTKAFTNDEVSVSNPWSNTITLGSDYLTEVVPQPLPIPNHASLLGQGVEIPNITPAGDTTPDIGALQATGEAPIYGNTLPQYVKDIDISGGPAWSQLSNSESILENVESSVGSYNVLLAWNSWAGDPIRCAVYAMGGGHNDYGGNEFYEISFNRSTPTAIRRLNASASVQNNQTHNDDGRPQARHTYWGEAFNEQDDKIMLAGGARYNNGFPLITTDSYNIGSNNYSPAGTHPNMQTGWDVADMVFCANPFTGDLIGPDSSGNELPSTWTRSSNTWVPSNSTGTKPNVGNGFTSTAFDTKRNGMFEVGGSQNGHHFYDVTTKVWTEITISGAEATTVQNSLSMGMIYIPSLDAFLLKAVGANGTVYKIAWTGAATMTATVFSVSGGSGITFPYDQSRPYNKFFAFPKLGVAVYFDAWDTNPWILKYEDAGPAMPGESEGGATTQTRSAIFLN